MKQALLISVYMNDEAKKANKPLFRREVFLYDSLIVDYQSHIETFRFLFGNSCVISFELYTY